MSVTKRILEANHFSTALPEGWIDHAYRAHLKLRIDKLAQVTASIIVPEDEQPVSTVIKTEIISVPLTKHRSKKADENQLSLF